MVRAGLSERVGVEAEIVTIHTEGDTRQEGPLSAHGGKGLFIKELEESLGSGHVDVAVHSCKDMPAEQKPEFVIGAILPREHAYDVLVSRVPVTIDQLDPGANVGTASVRRKAQLQAVRDDLEIMALRGNVDTRLRRVREGAFDAIVLAAAGIRRLGGADELCVTELEMSAFLPAPGQGAVAIETRADDARTADLVATLDNREDHAAVDAERAFAHELGGSCEIPVGAHATIRGETIVLDGCILSEDGSRSVLERIEGPVQDGRALAVHLARRVKDAGGAEILRSLLENDIQ
jgi:hydroxymethylbilane synthase